MNERMNTAFGIDSLLIDWINVEGRVCRVNDREAKALAIDPRSIIGTPLERVYSDESASLIRTIARGEQTAEQSFPVWMNSKVHGEMPMVASAVMDGLNGLAVVKQSLTPAVLGINR